MAADPGVAWAIFLDRDGVINRRARDGYVTTWAQFEFLPGAVEALAELTARGATTIVVTNQRGVARGALTQATLDEIHQRMADELAAHGARLAGIYVCPHEAGTCDCRKPALGLFHQAHDDYPSIDLSQADLVGDSLSDLEAGHRLGMRLWLVGEVRGDREQVAQQAARHDIVLSGSVASLIELVRDAALRGPRPVPVERPG